MCGCKMEDITGKIKIGTKPCGHSLYGFSATDMTETRVTSSTGGEKGSKPQRYSLLPKVALDTITEVFNFGTKKYAPHNYRKGYDWSLSYDALQRHLAAWWDGEENDRESGLSHLGHAGFHIIALIVFSKGTQYKKFDDRYKDPSLVDLDAPAIDIDFESVNRPPYYMPPFHPSLVSDWSSEDMTVSEDDKGVIQDEQALGWLQANPSLGVKVTAYPKLESDYPVLNEFFNDVGKLKFPATFEEAVKVVQSVEKPVVCEYKPFWSDAHGEYDLCKTHGYRSKYSKDEGPNRSCLFVDPWTKLEEIDD